MIAVVAYGVALLAASLLEWGVGDTWWPGTALSLAPRGLFFIPLLPLAVLAWRKKRPAIGLAIAFEAVFVAGPLMGFVVPWARFGASDEGPTIRIMTFNRGGVAGFDSPSFLRYLERMKVDIVCFQELARDRLLDQGLAERGWHVDRSGAIASRFPIVEDYPKSPDRNENHEGHSHFTATLYRARLIGPDGREFAVGCIHLPTARYAFRRLLRLDPSDIEPFTGWWGAEFVRMFELMNELSTLPSLVAGDFNAGPEATELAALCDSGAFRSAFDVAGLGWGYTRPSAFPFVRIDHILASPEWTIHSCWVGPSFGSDHKSMLADVAPPAKP